MIFFTYFHDRFRTEKRGMFLSEHSPAENPGERKIPHSFAGFLCIFSLSVWKIAYSAGIKAMPTRVARSIP